MTANDEALITEGRKLHDAWFDGPDMEARDRLIRMAKVAREIHQPRTIESIGAIGHLEGMVLLTAQRRVMLFKRGHWHSPGSMVWWSPMVDWLPATVLHEPTP